MQMANGSTKAIPATERILAALMSELRNRRDQLDADPGLRSITLVVNINERTGEPDSILFRTESKQDLRGRYRDNPG